MQQRSEESRRRILEASIGLFTSQGYDTTGIGDICEAAGLSKGGFYHHFGSKRELFLELYRGWIAGIENSMRGVTATGGNPQRRLMMLTGLLESVMADAAGQIPLFLEFWRQAGKDAEIRDAIARPFRGFRVLLTSLLSPSSQEPSGLISKEGDDPSSVAASMDPGEIPAAEQASDTSAEDPSSAHKQAESLARILIALGAGLVMESALDPAGGDWRSVTEDALRLLAPAIIPEAPK